MWVEEPARRCHAFAGCEQEAADGLSDRWLYGWRPDLIWGSMAGPTDGARERKATCCQPTGNVPLLVENPWKKSPEFFEARSATTLAKDTPRISPSHKFFAEFRPGTSSRPSVHPQPNCGLLQAIVESRISVSQIPRRSPRWLVLEAKRKAHRRVSFEAGEEGLSVVQRGVSRTGFDFFALSSRAVWAHRV